MWKCEMSAVGLPFLTPDSGGCQRRIGECRLPRSQLCRKKRMATRIVVRDKRRPGAQTRVRRHGCERVTCKGSENRSGTGR